MDGPRIGAALSEAAPPAAVIAASTPGSTASPAPLIPLGTHELRGIASPCEVFTVPEG